MANRPALRTLLAWFAFILSEKSARIGSIVFAYAHGGATTAGVVAMAQLLPGVVVAPLVATQVDRRSPATLLVWGFAVQAAGLVMAAVVVYAGAPQWWAYAGTVVAAVACAPIRPAQAALVPGLARSLDELSACNAVQGWTNSAGIVGAALLASLTLVLGQPGLVFAVAAALALLSSLLIARVSGESMAAEEAPSLSAVQALRGGLHVVVRDPQVRLLVGLTAAQYVVIGAMDVLFVTLAVAELGQDDAWAGYLSASYGVGAVVSGAAAVRLLGRPQTGAILTATAASSACLLVVALSHQVAITLALLAVIGWSRGLLTTATQTLLQRSVRPDELGRVFGIAEGARTAGLAAGSLLVPAMIALSGSDAAMFAVAAVVPLCLLLGVRNVGALDSAADVPVTEIALLRSMPHFRALPTPELEALARRATRVVVPTGTVVMRQGDVGDDFWIIADGAVEMTVDGRSAGTRHRPTGLGEIALLRRVPRTATATATVPTVLHRIAGDDFLAVVTGHDSTRRRSQNVVDQSLANDRLIEERCGGDL